MVTDLDAHLTERALTSLGAELTYREHRLAGAGVKDIDDYVELRTGAGAAAACRGCSSSSTSSPMARSCRSS